MAIIFLCDNCGKQLEARDPDAGKRARCTGCSKVQRIPGGAAGAGAARPDPPPLPAPRLTWPPRHLVVLAALVVVVGVAFWLGWLCHTPEVKIVHVPSGSPPVRRPLPPQPSGSAFPHPPVANVMGPSMPGAMSGPPLGGPTGSLADRRPGFMPPAPTFPEPDIDSRLRLLEGYRMEGGEVVINILGKVEGDWSLTLKTPGIKLGTVTFMEACKLIVQRGKDRTVLAEKEGILARDRSGNTWKSRKARLDGQDVFAFFMEKRDNSYPPRGDPNSGGAAGTPGPTPMGFVPYPEAGKEPAEIWEEVKDDPATTRAVVSRDERGNIAYGGTIAFTLPLGSAVAQPNMTAVGSFWIIAANGADWDGKELLPGRIYHVDGNGQLQRTQGEYSAWIVLEKECLLHAEAGGKGPVVATIRAGERVQLLLPAKKPKGSHKVRTGGAQAVEGWLDGTWKQLLFLRRVKPAAPAPGTGNAFGGPGGPLPGPGAPGTGRE